MKRFDDWRGPKVQHFNHVLEVFNDVRESERTKVKTDKVTMWNSIVKS